MDEIKKIILPMIKRVMPSKIASQIVGVQPMQGNTGHVFDIKYKVSKFIVTATWPANDGKTIYHIRIHNKEVLDWLLENFKDEIGFINKGPSETIVIEEDVYLLLQLKWADT